MDQWKEYPLGGEGAGSYEHWWSQHASFTYFLKDAHSLYLEVLGEASVPSGSYLSRPCWSSASRRVRDARSVKAATNASRSLH